MKKEIIFLLLFLVIGGSWLFSCHKEPPPNTLPPPIDYNVLPPITQTGANTFGCLVNGVVWVPRVELWVPWYDKAVNFHEKNGSGTGTISCRLLNELTDDFLTISFGRNYFQPTNYITVDHSVSDQWFNPDFRHGNETFHHENGDTTNYLKITAIDTSRNFISGIFQCTLFNANKTANLIITEGRFDLLYFSE